MLRRASSSAASASAALASKASRSASVAASVAPRSLKSSVLAASCSSASRRPASATRSCSLTSSKSARQAARVADVSWDFSSKCLLRLVRLSTSTNNSATLCAPFSVTSFSSASFRVSKCCNRSRNSGVNGSMISPPEPKRPRSLSSAHRLLASNNWSSRIAFSPCKRSRPSSASLARDSVARCAFCRSLHNSSKSRTLAFQASICWPTPLSWPNSCNKVSRSEVTVLILSLVVCKAVRNSPTSSRRWFERSNRALSVAFSCSRERRSSSSATSSCISSEACRPRRTCCTRSAISSSFFCSCFSNCQLRSKVSNSPSSTRALRRPSTWCRSNCSASAATRARNWSFSATRARMESAGPSAPSPSAPAGVWSNPSSAAPRDARFSPEAEEDEGVVDVLHWDLGGRANRCSNFVIMFITSCCTSAGMCCNDSMCWCFSSHVTA
mmetsp:Transcript_2222/g.6502  ORF Transcript_2222/g.6502 Transcript_2222/m.6502 type:complete len:441 (+) Transcript_2222:1214-2536(+)